MLIAAIRELVQGLEATDEYTPRKAYWKLVAWTKSDNVVTRRGNAATNIA
jgi:hypothetical protein